MCTVRCNDRCGAGVYLPVGVPAWGCTCPWRVPTLGGVPAWECTYQGGVDLPRRLYLPGGCTCLGAVPAQGLYLPEGVPAQGCVSAWGCVYPIMHWGRHPLWTEWLTDACENISLLRLRCRRLSMVRWLHLLINTCKLLMWIWIEVHLWYTVCNRKITFWA